MHDPASVELPPAIGLEETERPVPYVRSRIEGSPFKGSHLGTDTPLKDDYRSLLARYWGLVSRVGAAVGKILAAPTVFRELGVVRVSQLCRSVHYDAKLQTSSHLEYKETQRPVSRGQRSPTSGYMLACA